MDGRVQKFIERLEELGVAYESSGSAPRLLEALLGKVWRCLDPVAWCPPICSCTYSILCTLQAVCICMYIVDLTIYLYFEDLWMLGSLCSFVNSPFQAVTFRSWGVFWHWRISEIGLLDFLVSKAMKQIVKTTIILRAPLSAVRVWYSHAAVHVRFCVSFKALPTAAVTKATTTGMAVVGEGRVLLRVAFMKPSRKLVPDLHATSQGDGWKTHCGDWNTLADA